MVQRAGGITCLLRTEPRSASRRAFCARSNLGQLGLRKRIEDVGLQVDGFVDATSNFATGASDGIGTKAPARQTAEKDDLWRSPQQRSALIAGHEC